MSRTEKILMSLSDDRRSGGLRESILDSLTSVIWPDHRVTNRRIVEMPYGPVPVDSCIRRHRRLILGD